MGGNTFLSSVSCLLGVGIQPLGVGTQLLGVGTQPLGVSTTIRLGVEFLPNRGRDKPILGEILSPSTSWLWGNQAVHSL